jgi:hypothetical protein
MGVMDVQGIKEFGKGYDKNGGGGHPVCEKPEEQVLVSEEVIPGKGIGSRNRYQQNKNHIDDHVYQRVLEAVHPGGRCENLDIIFESEFLRKESHAAQDFHIRLKRCDQHPVDRNEQQNKIRYKENIPCLQFVIFFLHAF